MKWQAMPVDETDADRHLIFNALWGESPAAMVAVGESWGNVTVGTTRGVIYHWAGERWQPMPSGYFQTLYDIWGAASDDILAVGAGGTILHFDGRYWNAMESGTAEDLSFIGRAAASDAFAVSHWGTIFHYDGGTWKRYHEGPFGVLKYSNQPFKEGFAWPIAGESKDSVCLKFQDPYDSTLIWLNNCQQKNLSMPKKNGSMIFIERLDRGGVRNNDG